MPHLSMEEMYKRKRPAGPVSRGPHRGGPLPRPFSLTEDSGLSVLGRRRIEGRRQQVPLLYLREDVEINRAGVRCVSIRFNPAAETK